MSTPRRESGSDSEPCPEEIKEVADELASLRDQQIDPLTEPQKGAVEYIERRLRSPTRKASEASPRRGRYANRLPVTFVL